ncbi:GDSL-type esterase/lipase family protein [Microbispora sp. H13382]|uniref:GDSL-type esterase/lipase family protein n=1 Tax=Microbispora sp. H13382 TaxID=2729112 RepID=UPI00160259E7|nr:GDSL-type esterase/lipase family protein [Microbispora sp. H13382]
MQRWRTGHLVALLLCLAVAVAGPARPTVAAAAAAGQCARITSPFAGSPAGDGGLTLRVGCASEAGSLRSLAGNDNDLVAALDFDTSERPEQWQTLINQQVAAVRADQTGGLSLGQSLVKQSRVNGPGLYQAPDNGVDYNGSIQVVGSSIVIVVPAGDIAVSGVWDGVWRKFLVGMVNLAVAVSVSALCLIFSAPEAPVTAPLCAALGAGFGAAFGELLSARLDDVPIDGTVWGNALGAALAAAIAVGTLGLAVTFLTSAGRQLASSLHATVKSWAPQIGTSIVDKLKEVINEGTIGIIKRTLERHMRGLQPSGASLRVMALGDSITAGVGSTAMNGYRVPLQDRLRAAGVTFDFVGSQANGVSTADVQHEGHSGWRIDEIAARLPDWLSTYRPELVTLHLGTNDMIQDYQTSGAVERLGGVIDQIFAGDPGVTVVVSSLVPSRTAAIDARIRQFNQNSAA